MQSDFEKEREAARLNKSKLDKEISLKDLHDKKRKELSSKEVDACLMKLSEINNKIEKG